MIIMGIDPGLATAGYGVIDWDRAARRGRSVAFGAFTSKASQPMGERLAALAAWLRGLIDQHRPEVVAIEEVFFARNVKTAVAMAHARGVCLLVPAERAIPTFEYSARLVKQSVAGHGGAEKEQVQRMVRVLLAMCVTPEPDHAADGLALALCHAHQMDRPGADPEGGGDPAGSRASRGSRSRSRAAWRKVRPIEE